MGKEIKNTSFENGIKESFCDFSHPPVPAVWSRIEANLHRRRKIVLFSRLAAAATFLLLFGISGWMFYHNSSPNSTPLTITESKSQPNIPERIQPVVTETNQETVVIESGTEKPTMITHPLSPKTEKTGTTKLIIESDSLAEELDVEIALSEPVSSEETEAPMLEDIKTESENSEIGAAEQNLEALKEFDLLLQKDDFLAEKPMEKNWQLGLSYGTIGGNAEGDPATTYESTSADFTQDLFSTELAAETKRFEDLENTTHSHPITIGFLVNRALSGKWGLETGLLFTKLKTSASTNPVNNSYTEYISEMLYVGIPLSVRFTIVDGRKFGMYASQGLVLEKGVKTRYNSYTYLSDELTDSQTSSYTAQGVQLSSLTALGVEYKLSNLLSIYLQPGFQVFFLNETQPFNIRSSSPFWPSVQTGLRFKL